MLSPGPHDSATWKRVLEWSYCRSYDDGEYPPGVPSWLASMTVAQAEEALEVVPGSIDDTEDLEWTAKAADGVPCFLAADEDQDGELEDDEDDGYSGDYIPYYHDIECPLEYDSGSDIDDDCLIATITLSREDKDKDSGTEDLQPPYDISLLTNLRVYLLAQELEMPVLQLLARERFVHTATCHWHRFEGLSDLLDELYKRTEEADPVRTFMCRLVAASYRTAEDPLRTLLRNIMEKNGTFARDVLDCTSEVLNVHLGTGASDV